MRTKNEIEFEEAISFVAKNLAAGKEKFIWEELKRYSLGVDVYPVTVLRRQKGREERWSWIHGLD